MAEEKMQRLLDEDTANKEMDTVARFADKNQRLAWKRKMNRMDELLERIQPLEEKALEIIKEKQPIMDEIERVRQMMVKECVHPKDYLVHKGDHILCKFCKSKLAINLSLTK